MTTKTIAIVVAAVGTVAATSPAHADGGQHNTSGSDGIVAAVPTSAPDVPAGTPTYNFTKPDNRTSGDVSIMADLPFSYTFEYEATLYGRNLDQTGQVCNDIDLYTSRTIYVSLWRNVWGPDQKIGPTVAYPPGWHTWCWDGGQGTFTYYFYYENGYAKGAGYAHNP